MTDPSDPDFARSRALTRLNVVEGLLRSIELGWPLIQAIEEAEDRNDAALRLQQEPFDFDEIQAHHVVDLMPQQRTRSGRRNLAAEQRELKALIAGE